MSERLVAIRTCDECPQGGQYYDYCLAVQPHRHLEDDRPEIPHWCPLPNAASGWVPVEERPPEPDVPVLAVLSWGSHRTIEIVTLFPDGDWWWEDDRIPPEDVSHWQPLPPLPEDAE